MMWGALFLFWLIGVIHVYKEMNWYTYTHLHTILAHLLVMHLSERFVKGTTKGNVAGCISCNRGAEQMTKSGNVLHVSTAASQPHWLPASSVYLCSAHLSECLSCPHIWEVHRSSKMFSCFHVISAEAHNTLIRNSPARICWLHSKWHESALFENIFYCGLRGTNWNLKASDELN